MPETLTEFIDSYLAEHGQLDQTACGSDLYTRAKPTAGYPRPATTADYPRIITYRGGLLIFERDSVTHVMPVRRTWFVRLLRWIRSSYGKDKR